MSQGERWSLLGLNPTPSFHAPTPERSRAGIFNVPKGSTVARAVLLENLNQIPIQIQVPSRVTGAGWARGPGVRWEWPPVVPQHGHLGGELLCQCPEPGAAQGLGHAGTSHGLRQLPDPTPRALPPVLLHLMQWPGDPEAGERTWPGP